MLKRIKKSSFLNFPLILILGLASHLRFFRFRELLGFWYDQGRDALVIWDMIYKGKLTLIGPQMGFTGIFRGAWYYWLIAPFYALGSGDPVVPALFITLTTIAAILGLYLLGTRIGGRKVGLLSALIASVSVHIIGASRWFSDPTPTLLISVLFFWALLKISEEKKWALPLSTFLAGMALQFSAAAEIFYIPAIIVIVYIFRRKIKFSLKNIFLSLTTFIIPFAPQILFEVRHPGVQSTAIINFLFHEKTFSYAFWEILKTRLPFDYNMFASKFWVEGGMFFGPFFLIFAALIIFNWKKLWKIDQFKILFILAVTPFIGTLFFVSNLGGVYEYYFTGYYLIWILLFSYVFMSFSRNFLIKFAIFVFCIFLLIFNFNGYRKNYLGEFGSPETITLSQQTAAIDWIYEDVEGVEFNVDVYVPPVIPHAYDYLFRWLGKTKYGQEPLTKNTDLLYTLYELDFNHPERLKSWLDRQSGIGSVTGEEKFGNIVVQRRQRLLFE